MSILAATNGPPVILASGSRARAALLTAAGVPFTTVPALVDEAGLRDALRAERVRAEDAAVALAEMKAAHVAARAPDTAPIRNYSKKMIATLSRELLKIRRNLLGIRDMNRLPDALVIVGPNREHIAIKEAKRMGVTTVALIDTDSDPDPVDPAAPPVADGAGGAARHVCDVAFCPIGLALSAVQPLKPDVVEHLLVAGREFLLAAKAVIDARVACHGHA